MTDDYRAILACRDMGQIDEKVWQSHLSDPLFRLWLDHHDRENAK